MPRIYVACLASYNNGCLHGAWIDADQDADAIRTEIRAMLKASPYPNVTRADYECHGCGHEFTRDVSPYQNPPAACPECEATDITMKGEPYPSAEEYAIHDHEDFGRLVEEYTGIDEIVQLAEAIAEHDGLYIALREYGFDHDEAISKLEDDYQGEHRDLEDWAENFLEDTGLFHGLKNDNPLRNYFDYERYARDAQLSGDILVIEVDGKTHVFWNH